MPKHTIKVSLLLLISIVSTLLLYILFRDFYDNWRWPRSYLGDIKLTVWLLLGTEFLIFDALAVAMESTPRLRA